MQVGQRAQRFGQRARRWNLDARDQDRDHRDPAFECRFQFEPDEIARIVEANTPVLVLRGQPARTDRDQHDLAVVERLLDDGPEIRADADGIDVLEDFVAAEIGFQIVVDAADHVGNVAATIRDEDPAHNGARACRIQLIWAGRTRSGRPPGNRWRQV